MKSAYMDMDEDYWDAASIKKLIKLFPEGQICVTVNEVVVGCALSIMVDYKKFGDKLPATAPLKPTTIKAMYCMV
jgi:hypothetical protein